MDSTSSGETELHSRLRQQEVVAELGQQALETDDLDELLHDATVAVAETLDTEYAKVLELLPGGDEVHLRHGVGWRESLVGNATVPTDRDSQAGYTLLTERKAYERALEKSKRRYQTLVDNFPNGAVGLFDETMTYTVVGGEFLDDLGLSPEEIVGTTIYERYPDELVDEIRPHFDAVFDGESSTFEFDLEG